jgi:hypothetical protein
VFRSSRGAWLPRAAAGISLTLQKQVVSLKSVLAFDAGGAWQQFVRALPRRYL